MSTVIKFLGRIVASFLSHKIGVFNESPCGNLQSSAEDFSSSLRETVNSMKTDEETDARFELLSEVRLLRQVSIPRCLKVPSKVSATPIFTDPRRSVSPKVEGFAIRRNDVSREHRLWPLVLDDKDIDLSGKARLSPRVTLTGDSYP